MKKIVLGILIAIVSMVILGFMITVVSLAAFAGKIETKSGISGEAWVGVEIKIEGSDTKTNTDFNGPFVIINLKAGQSKLVTSYTSLKKRRQPYLLIQKPIR